MDIVLVNKDKDSIEVLLDDPSGNVLLEPLKDKLLNDPTVEIATHDSDHPMYGKRVLFVRVKSGKPQNAVKRALKDLSGEYTSLKKALDKAEPTK
jgi:DNA-directed RNA polymerase subunit L